MWERRHGLLQPQRTQGGHRLYTQDDLRVLFAIKSRMDRGASIGELARQGREALLWESPPPHLEPPRAATQVAPTDALNRWQTRLADAAQALDGQALERTLDEVFATLDPAAVIARVIRPFTRELGRRWERDELNVASEHLASEVLSRRLLHLLAAAQTTSDRAPVALVACVPDERHDLGALVQAWELARSGHRVTWLGSALPLADLAQSILTVHPDVVYLSTTLPETYEACRTELASLIAGLPGDISWRIGGQGVPPTDPALLAMDVELDSEQHIAPG